MIRHCAALLLLLPAACDRQQEAPKPKETRPAPALPAPQAEPSAAERETGEAAARALRHYYALIGAGEYREAYRLRTAGGADQDRFAANFAAYQSYSALVGAPSQPVAQGDYVYVQLPVMITGRFKGGAPFGSSGTVMVRRARAGGAWLVLADR